MAVAGNAPPVIIVAAGGLPVTNIAAAGAPSMTVVSARGLPITLVAAGVNGATPVTLLNPDGTLYS